MNLRCKNCGGKSENLVNDLCEHCIEKNKTAQKPKAKETKKKK